MHAASRIRPRCVWLALIALGCAAQFVAWAQKDVTQPGDPMIASSSNSPGSEGVANAIDGQPTKYLNFDTRTSGKPSGFVVTPSIGATLVNGITMQSANDAPERDPKIVTLEGSNDATVTDFASGNWELIVRFDAIPAWTARFQTQTFFFNNCKAYKHYRWTVIETQTINGCCMQIAEVELLGTTAPKDVTQPGDPMIASSSNSPGSEGVANAIDGQPTKYLNFDTRTSGKPSGFIVTPSIGATLVTGITMTSANDAPERDPKIVTLEGSNDATVTDFASGNWELIVRFDNIPAWTARFQMQTFCFDNCKGYKHYRWTVIETQTINGCCMQIAEVELLGTGAPKDVTQPGDPVIASSSNSPGSEGVANAIDGQPTKYLNFDTRTSGKPSGFVVTPSIGATTVIGMTMQSANDAPERDPKIVTLEGSNDATVTDFASGNWEQIVRLDNIPAWTARFQTQTICFPNKKSYKHYRWTVLQTQTINGCCMQIAEVELLAVTEGCPPGIPKFLVQPVNTPVLQGSQATFFVSVNGPWPLQWLKNGTPIPGATSPSYTTPAVTPQNAGDVFSVVMCGDNASDSVKATIFTPASNKSVGISFRGGGANGAPTLMNDDDIAGVWLQAHWNNSANAEDGTFPYDEGDPPVTVVLKDSDGLPTDITFQWDTSGQWGSGTGNASATQRMLNGLNGDSIGDAFPCAFTFGNVPDGEHSVLVYAVSPPLQFQTVSFKITGTTEKTYYMRTMNSDEYNAAPGFYSCFSTDVNKPEVGDFIRFDKVRPLNGVITLETHALTSADRETGVNAVQLVLNAPTVSPLAITADPQPTVVQDGGAATLSVTATGDNLSYQWRKDGRPLPNGGNVSGANTAMLTICPFTSDDEAVYSVAVFSSGGSKVSKNAAVRITKCNIQDALVGYWKLDETGGLSAANSVSGGKAAAVNGTPVWQAGLIGNAFNFDGYSYLFVPDYPVAKKAISAAAWVNIPVGAIYADVAIIRNAQGEMRVSGGAARVVGQFEIGIDFDDATGAARPMATIGIGPNIARAIGPAEFPTGAWHHIAFTADGAQLRLYVDGVEVAVEDYLAEINPPDIPYISMGARLNVDTSVPPILGPDLTYPNYLTGPMDDAAVWTRALPASTVKAVYDAGKLNKALTTVTETCPPLVPCAGPPELSYSFAGGNITVAWTGGTLQTATVVTGPWTDSAATTPLTEPATGAAKFYRAVRK
jgi:hypothetical protein